MGSMSETSKLNKRKSVPGKGDANLQDSVQFLTNEHTNTKLRGNAQLQSALEKIEEVATETGLGGEDLARLLDVAASGKFPETVSMRLVKSLIPSHQVPDQAVLSAVSWMCTNKPSSALQSLLVRWILVVYDAIENKDTLHSLYGIFFYFLESETMCPHICHLLYLLTRKNDVQLFRVRVLLRLQQKMGAQPYLLGLLLVYKLYYPQLAVSAGSRKTFFRQTDRAWAESVRNALSARQVAAQLASAADPGPEEDDQGSESPPRRTTSILDIIAASAPKRRKPDLVPNISAPRFPPAGSKPAANQLSHSLAHGNKRESVHLAQISSFKELLQNLDRLELPNQMTAVLRDRNLQHVMLCYPDPAIPTRLVYWLDHVLYEEFLLRDPLKERRRSDQLLEMLIAFSDFLKEGVPVCENFLVKYLHLWNGDDFQPRILRLITRLRLHPFPALNDLVLEPLRKIFFASSVDCKCQIVKCLTELLRNLVLVEWPRYKYNVTLDGQRNPDVAHSQLDLPNCFSVFSDDFEDCSPMECISQYIDFMDSMVTVGLATEGDHCLLFHTVLSFYELVCTLHQEYQLPLVIIPGKAVTYRCLFSVSAATLSRFCAILCRYREGYTSLRHMATDGLTPDELHAQLQLSGQVKMLNSCILDYCDSLCRYKAFATTHPTSVYGLLAADPALLHLSLPHVNQAFSLQHHPALLGYVCRYLAKTQLGSSRIHPDLIKHKDQRTAFQQFLEQQEVHGTPEFILTYISTKHSHRNS